MIKKSVIIMKLQLHKAS